MTSRRWITWGIFLICALLVFDGLGFVTWQVLRLERREAQATLESARQENERLALWRMDFFMAPLLAQESARPYFDYLPFYSAERAYTRMWEQVQPGEVLVASELLIGSRSPSSAGQLVRLYFQIDAQGRFTSPQVPTGNMLDLAESRFGLAGRIEPNERLLEQIRRLYIEVAREEQARTASRAVGQTPGPAPLKSDRRHDRAAETRPQGVPADEDAEFARRARSIEQAAAPEQRNDAMTLSDATPRAAPPTQGSLSREQAASGASEPDSAIRVGNFRPRWLRSGDSANPELILVRDVMAEGQLVRQCIWIDWPMLRTLLITGVLDLLPDPKLAPITGPEGESASLSRVMASLPVILDPGPMPEPGPLGLTWVRATLGATWLAIVAAVAAIGWVLRASLVLSERRGRFVSAVTHELRTPLTTFCLYTEMLDEGMVDPTARQSYLATLRSESRRLAGIVENVLAYARLGRARPRTEGSLPVGDLVEQVRDVLERRVEQTGGVLQLHLSAGAASAAVRGEPESIERILLNLVDNACKYGRIGDEPPGVTLSVSLEHHRVVFRVCDQGPGIAPGERGRVFGAFQRGAVHASHAESGLGLGLALSRGLADEMGGELTLEPSQRGACFALRLKVG
ncbi:MAG: sensor histidine kinase [Leptolyngbya sp. PLA3]|nr:MAG: sensor histidine kinase [Cyanobacteria bacterium CYA]MCE7967281.1 sensor histidine kinase [Leptolyngbya sp. PL-A3]